MAEPRRLTQLAAAVEEAIDLPAGPLVVALSGGADSAALLWMCRRLGRSARAVHIHHGLAASDQLEASARSVVKALNVDLAITSVSVPPGASPEAQARSVRYEALEEAALGGEWVLTAHTSDDQAETMLDHLLRASGLDGLRGIRARRPPFARPFLSVSRSQTRELATLAGLEWMDDPLNQDPDPLRNRIRSHLIPLLEERYNPRLRQSLATTAGLVATDLAYLDSLVEAPIEVSQREVVVAASLIATAPPSPAARLVRRLLAAAGLPNASPAAVQGVLEVAGGRIESHQPGRDVVVRRRGALVVAETGLTHSLPSVDLAVPGETIFGSWVFDTFLSDTPPRAFPIGAAWMVADADRMADLRVEAAARHPGALERLAEAGVAAGDRQLHPVLVAGDIAVWVPLVRRLPYGWADPGSERYLVVRTRARRTCHRYEP